jgi:opacity protein-like surface antigen
MFFIGPGFSQAQWYVNSKAATGGNIGVTGSHSTWLTGWGLKSGVEIVLARHVNLVLTYQYTSFDSVSWSNVEPLSGNSLSARYTPSVNSVLVGITLQ